MNDIVIRTENLGKRYRLGEKVSYVALRDEITDFFNKLFVKKKQAANYIWALKNISFDVKRGEVVGIIGGNGAGKSTLLKILSRITAPTEGIAKIHGRIGSLLEVGTGFHPELTGRENIYLNGSILGMRKREISQKFDAIVAFAEIEKFIDTPVKRYSSGMFVRLAFSVAAHLEPEILFVDEVLAVGDVAFQKKCLGRMGDVAKEGRTILFVSHNMAAVASLCQRGIVIDKGSVSFIGSQTDAITQYLKSFDARKICLRDRTDHIGSGDVKIVGIEFRDKHGHTIDTVASGQDVDICLYFETKPGFNKSGVIVGLRFNTHFDMPVFLHHNRLTRNDFGKLPQSGVFICRLKRLPLPPSSYRIAYSVVLDRGYLDAIGDAAELTVVGGDFFGSGEVPPASHGVCLVDGLWRLE